jgi:hypothetical protein
MTINFMKSENFNNFVTKRITLKKVVAGKGHDCGGLIADIYLDGKKIAEYHDDGWGGEAEHRFLDGKEAILEQAVKEAGLKQIISDMYLYGDDEKMYETPEKVHLCAVVDFIVEDAHLLHIEKGITTRLCKRNFVAGTLYSHIKIAWKGCTLEEVGKRKGGVKQLQDAYDDAVKEAKKLGGKVFNTPAQLKELGIVARHTG